MAAEKKVYLAMRESGAALAIQGTLERRGDIVEIIHPLRDVLPSQGEGCDLVVVETRGLTTEKLANLVRNATKVVLIETEPGSIGTIHQEVAAQENVTILSITDIDGLIEAFKS